MALTPGTRIGSYEIAAQIGVGGMGEVYRATDTKLGRQVAIKVLPDAVASDADRLARFDREARTLAVLNHPNIAAVHGLEDADGFKAIVMELVEGPTLADRITRGPIPVDEVLAIATQMAEALEAAHEQGIVHRDLKPANVKVRPDGAVKVLDFGLAKAMELTGAMSASPSMSPTITTPAMTQAGLILGTAAYMSPEQARGVAVDRRADIWALGCVLYEMLTGQQAFGGELISDVMASVLKAEPDYGRLPPHNPRRLRALVVRCLEKDPKRRWRDVGDVRVELEQIRDAPTDTLTDEPQRLRRGERAIWAAAVLMALAAIWLVSTRVGSTPDEGGRGYDEPLAFQFSPPEGASFYPHVWRIPFALSPDGQWLAYAATVDGGPSRLWIREMSSLAAQAITGTEGAVEPFWSPDSRWVGFTASDVLYRVRIPGGTPQLIARTVARFPAWSPGGEILFTNVQRGLSRVPVEGGSTSPVTTANSEFIHRWPQFVDESRFLYAAGSGPTRIYAASIGSNLRQLVMEIPAVGSTIAHVPGYLLYVQDGVLWAQPIDDVSLAVDGARRRIARGIPIGGGGAAPFSVSPAGVLAYWTQSLIQRAQLQWMERDGTVLTRVGQPAVYDGFDLSPDDTLVAAAQVEELGNDIWVYDLESGGAFSAAFNTETRGDTVPVWTRDGAELTFLAPGVAEGSALKRAGANSSADPVTLVASGSNKLAGSWNAAGDQLVFEDFTFDNGVDLVVFHADDGRIEPLPWNTRSDEIAGRLSPDDQWVAYVTNQSGQNEVWVAAYPSGQPRRQVSPAGGTHPDWSGDGTELFFISADRWLVSVALREGDGSSFVTGPLTKLFQMPGPIDIVAGSHNMFKAASDGQRFLVAAKVEATDVPPLNIVVNWRALLEGE